jgi:uncharacterized protein YjbJ (UPF0337 family)
MWAIHAGKAKENRGSNRRAKETLTRLKAIHRPIDRKECVMNWDRVEGNWKQFTGKVKENWGKLTDDDITTINGRQEQLIGRIQERYGVAKDEAQKQVNRWVGGL